MSDKALKGRSFSCAPTRPTILHEREGHGFSRAECAGIETGFSR
jgi:hypothetical protein